jgi:hypothetical protein
VWPQSWDLQGPRGLDQRDLRNLNLGDLKKGPNGGISPTPQKKHSTLCCLLSSYLTRLTRYIYIYIYICVCVCVCVGRKVQLKALQTLKIDEDMQSVSKPGRLIPRVKGPLDKRLVGLRNRSRLCGEDNIPFPGVNPAPNPRLSSEYPKLTDLI